MHGSDWAVTTHEKPWPEDPPVYCLLRSVPKGKASYPVIATVEKHHLPTKPGDLCAIDLYGGLPTSRSGVKYILVCYDVFSKHVKLYPLKGATTKACLNKLINKYFGEVIEPKAIMSDNGNQFRSRSWKRKLSENEVEVHFSPVRQPQSNPSEGVMKELSKFCRIDCHQNHKHWAIYYLR